MASLIDSTFIEMLTGIPSECFPEEILNLAEAKANQTLGFLEQDTRTKEYYLYRDTMMLNLAEPTANVTEVKWRSSAGDYSVIDSTKYRFVAGILKFEQMLYEDSDVVITYELGWAPGDVPELVLLYLTYVALDILNTLHPGSFQTSILESKKLGDYSVKYHINSSTDSPEVSFTARIDQLATLIKQGNFEPGASN